MSLTNRSSTFDLQPSRLHQAIQGILLVSVLTVSVAANAESTNNTGSVKRSYHISGGSLSQALRQFATNSGLLFSAEAKLTDGKTTAGLDGEYTVEEGFKKLLAGSGLTYTFTDDNSVAIKLADSKSDTVLNLPAVKVTGKAVSDPNDPYNPDYSLPNASTATKTDTPIMNTPVNIQVVSKALMNDQQDTNIVEALTKNVSGVQAEHGSGNIYENFIIRGFSADSNVYRNGLRRGMNNFDPANIDQLEVLKSPAAMLYGRGQPGGMVNYVTKKGLNKPYYSLQQQFGTYDQYRTTVDATGPLDEAGTLSYRFNGSYQDMGSFKDFINDQRVFIAPTLSYKPNDRFEANFELEYKHEKRLMTGASLPLEIDQLLFR